jgi:hypothetical protein
MILAMKLVSLTLPRRKKCQAHESRRGRLRRLAAHCAKPWPIKSNQTEKEASLRAGHIFGAFILSGHGGQHRWQ